MFDKLASEENRYDELTRLLSTAEVQADPNEMRKHAKALSELEPLVEKYREYKSVASEIAQADEMVAGSDADMRELAKEELKSLTARRDALIGDLKVLLVPKDPNDQKNVVLEIRAGTGGDEAALFAGELFRMYSKYAERQGWKIEVMSSSDTGVGGLKEVIAAIEERGRYSTVEDTSGRTPVEARRSQVGTGERSEKIRTYNFPQSRITDHRINFTTHQLEGVLNGDLAELLDNVSMFYQSEKLKDATAVS